MLLCFLYIVYIVHPKRELVSSSFNVNLSHSTNLNSHFVDWSLDNCVLVSVVMVLGQAEYGMLIKIISYSYSKAER